jgi:hypothetical protein
VVGGWLNRISGWVWQALEVEQRRIIRGMYPSGHVGRGIRYRSNPRNSTASGQFAANARRTRLAVSLIRTAIFSRRARMVENSALAKGCGLGMTSRTTRISQ